MTGGLREKVRAAGAGRCEYCQLPETASILPFEIEHIIAEKHGGETVFANLAYACRYCNSYKGPNIAGMTRQQRRSFPYFIRASNGGGNISAGAEKLLSVCPHPLARRLLSCGSTILTSLRFANL